MVLPALAWLAALGVSALVTSCGFSDEPEEEVNEYTCPVLDDFPPNQNINYADLSFYSMPGFETFGRSNVKELADSVATKAELIPGNFRFFIALNQLIREKGEIPNPKPSYVSDLICTRSAELVLSDENINPETGKLLYSGCHDIGLIARSVLILLGYNVVFVDSVSEKFLEGGSYSGHVFLEVQDPLNNNELFLYDPTAGKIYLDYDPNNYTLPGGYLVYAKSLDSWSMSIVNVSQLNTCLRRYRDEFYGTSLNTSLREINYQVINLNKK